MEGVNPKNFEYVIQKVGDGFLFEEFAARFLSQLLGEAFTPAGGVKDKGIDGLEHVFVRKGFERKIYQASIEKKVENKVRSTLDKLLRNKIDFDRLVFVSNQVVKNQEAMIDALYDEFGKPVYVYDIKWLSGRVNTNPGTITTYHTFVNNYLHEFKSPGKEYVVGNLVDDPRLYVFLRQQWETDTNYKQIDTLLTDSLILYALEGTDPDKNLFRTKDEIKAEIGKKISFDPKVLYGVIDTRLRVLSKKPLRKIKHHTDIDAYCLPYETRLMIQERNISDACLREEFQLQSSSVLEKELKNASVKVRDCLTLMEAAFNQIYYRQGLEFSNFVLKGENREAFEKDLYGTISQVVDESSVIGANKELVKSALMITVREIVYHGTQEQKEFLQKLSNTYLMLFLLQCDPKICMFFESMASQLQVYVCTSVIIPAMSELFLEEGNRRHWNLLKGAGDAGVKLIVNETILGELVSHFRMITTKYGDIYRHQEEVFLSHEIGTLYIDEILIRSYFYAKMRGQISSFYEFVDNFVSPDLKNVSTEILRWLQEEFKIVFVSNSSLGVSIKKAEEDKLFERLKYYKSAPQKARNDARLILTLYAIREKQNEAASASIFGYKTWWLSKDTLTSRAVNEILTERYPVSCYMRPDFLYNYISLAPRRAQIHESYGKMFPTLVGVNISFHLPNEIVQCVHTCLKEHETRNPARRSAILVSLAEQLKSDRKARTRSFVKHYLDERLAELEKGG